MRLNPQVAQRRALAFRAVHFPTKAVEPAGSGRWPLGATSWTLTVLSTDLTKTRPTVRFYCDDDVSTV